MTSNIKKTVTFSFNKEDYYYENPDIWGTNQFEIMNFEGCCGASILCYLPIVSKKLAIRNVEDFIEGLFSEFEYNISDETEIIRLKIKATEHLDIFLDYLQRAFDTVRKKGHITFLILNDTQYWMNSFVKKQGFRLVSNRTVNSNTDQRLHVYMYDPLTPKRKLKRLRKSSF